MQNTLKFTKVRAHEGFLIYVSTYGYFEDLGRSHMFAACRLLLDRDSNSTNSVQVVAIFTK